MKMKKVLISTLVLAMMVMVNGFSYAENQIQSFPASVNFEDFIPALSHGNPSEEYGGRIVYLISCNMVLKPKSKIHLSRLCDSATTNVKYYMNNSESDIKKGPDYINTVEDETFYPASKRIANSYIGGKVSYKVATDFHTESPFEYAPNYLHKEVPSEFQPVVIISSMTIEVDLGVATPLSVPTGDQSQPNWTGTSGVFPGFEGVRVPWTYDFGYLENNDEPSGISGLFRVKSTNSFIIHLKSGYFGAGDGHIIFGNGSNKTTMPEEKRKVVLAAKKLYIQYNENASACDAQGAVLIEDGWENLPEEHYSKFVIESDGNISYPPTMNAWIRISAVLESPTAEDCRPVRRTIVKGRIGTKYPGFEFKNMKEGDVLKIYTVNGKKIKEISSGTPDGFVWDGRKDNGDWAKSGIYVYQLKHDGKLISGTIVFVY